MPDLPSAWAREEARRESTGERPLHDVLDEHLDAHPRNQEVLKSMRAATDALRETVEDDAWGLVLTTEAAWGDMAALVAEVAYGLGFAHGLAQAVAAGDEEQEQEQHALHVATTVADIGLDHEEAVRVLLTVLAGVVRPG